MNSNQFIQRLLNDIRVDLSDEFDKNFSRKAFFNEKWQERKSDGKGSLLLATGKLRRSIRAKVVNESIVWTSSEIYALIHNEGGDITVTPALKAHFWKKYYSVAGKIHYSRSGTQRQNKTNDRISSLAGFYKAMALMKVGSKIHIPKRQFIGFSPEVRKRIELVFKHNLKGLQTQVTDILKPKKI
jgi:Mu-like prophage protein gpG